MFFIVILMQTSLAAARHSLAADIAADGAGKETSTSPGFYDSEDATSMGSRSPGGATPVKYSNANVDGAGRGSNGGLTAVNNLVKEFEQRKQSFDDDARKLVDVKTSAPFPHGNPVVDLRKLKARFDAWKNDYKARLREAKVRLHKLALSEVDKNRRSWWGRLSSKIQQ